LRWEKEVDLVTRLFYLGLTTGLRKPRGNHVRLELTFVLTVNPTLGEEYVGIWQRVTTTRRPPTLLRRWMLILFLCIPPYLAAREEQRYRVAPSEQDTLKKRLMRLLPGTLEFALEANLAIFYFAGTYYSLAKRLLGIRQVYTIFGSVQLNYLTSIQDIVVALRSQRPFTVLRPPRSLTGDTARSSPHKLAEICCPY
jgi:peroxin-10